MCFLIINCTAVNIYFILTVVAKDEEGSVLRGLFCGNDRAVYEQAAQLSQQVNISLLDDPIQKAVAYLPPGEFKTTWLANKAIYRLRMAMADGGRFFIFDFFILNGKDIFITLILKKLKVNGILMLFFSVFISAK